jgi:hypothetical protein
MSVTPPSPLPTAAPLETVLATVAGLVVSSSFVGWALSAAETRWGRLVVGWAFVLPAGVLDTIPNLFGASVLTRSSVLTTFAALVGAVTGYMGGKYRAYDWRRRGVLQFVADLTWGLSGSTVGAFMHVWNALQKLKPLDRHQGAHRYAGGFTMGANRSFTQGPVMSCLGSAPGEPLFVHEKVHVFQHRLFGPVYPVTYLAWLLVWTVIAAMVSFFAKGLKSRVDAWSYFSNPWEAWAYQKHSHAQVRHDGPFEGAAQFRKLYNTSSFRNSTVIWLSLLFFPGMALVFALVLTAVF